MKRNQSGARPRQPKTGFKPHSLSENKLRLSKPDLILYDSTKENIQSSNLLEKSPLSDSPNKETIKFMNLDDTNENISEGIVKIPYPVYKSLSPLNGLFHSESFSIRGNQNIQSMKENLELTTKTTFSNMIDSEAPGDPQKKIVLKTKGKILKGKFGIDFLKSSGKKVSPSKVVEGKKMAVAAPLVDSFRIEKDIDPVKFMEMTLVNEKFRLATSQHSNDELSFEIKSLRGDLSSLKDKWTLKDNELKACYLEFEKMKRKYANLQQKISYLDRSNKNLVAQMTDFMRIKML